MTTGGAIIRLTHYLFLPVWMLNNPNFSSPQSQFPTSKYKCVLVFMCISLLNTTFTTGLEGSISNSIIEMCLNVCTTFKTSGETTSDWEIYFWLLQKQTNRKKKS